MSADAGWYADPSDPAWVRYWDGTAWSPEAHPAAAVPRTADPAPATPAPAPAPAPVQAVPSLEPLAPVTVTVREPVGAGVATGGASRSAIPTLEPLAPVAPAASVTTPVVTAAPAPAARPEPVRTLTPAPAAAPAAPAAPPVSPGFAPDPLGTEPAHGRHPIDRPATTSTLPGSAPWEAAAPVRPGGNGAVGGARFGGTGAPSGPVVRSGSAAPIPVGSLPGTGGGHLVKRLVIAVVVLALLGAAYTFGVGPKLREKQALDAAAQTPTVLPHAAPRALAGQKAMSAPGINPSASASTATQQGSSWAWGASYGKGPERTVYLAADVPADTRADAVRAQTDPAAAERLISTISTRMAITPTAISNGTPSREYGSEVGGKAWCMPVTLNGNGGGWCVWTNGREMLQVLSYPSVQEMSAKHTLAALEQLARQPAAPAKPAKK